MNYICNDCGGALETKKEENGAIPIVPCEYCLIEEYESGYQNGTDEAE